MPTTLKLQITSVTVESVSREKQRKEKKREDNIITVFAEVNVSLFALPGKGLFPWEILKGLLGCASFSQC